jgi:ABC-type transport system substrate-binding protein
MSRRTTGLTAALTLLVLASAPRSQAAPAPATAAPPPAAAPPAAAPPRVYVGVYLNDITKFDQKDGVFDADLIVWAKWLGAFDKGRLQIANAAKVDQKLLDEQTDGPWHSARWSVRGTLRGEFPVHRFPFDRQTVAVMLELPERAGELTPDLVSSGMRERFSVTGWLYDPVFRPRQIREVYRSDLGQIPTEGEPTTVRRASFEVTMRRPALAAGFKFFLPLAIICLVALLPLFIHPSSAPARASTGVTALLACFAFQFSVANTIPAVAYLTLSDLIFMVAYGFTMLGLTVTVTSHFLHQGKREEAALRLDRAARVALPVLALGAVLIIATRGGPATARVAAAAAAPAAAITSVRDEVRVGTTILLGAGAMQAIYGTEEPGPGVAPPHLEEVPDVSSDSLRFLAGGRLEVRWRLKPGLRWSDGQPLTTRDLAFAAQAAPNRHVVDVRAVNDREIVLTWDDRLAAALRPPAVLPRHVLEPVFATGGLAALEQHAREHALPSLGPYRVAGFVAGDHLRLERNPHYAGPPAAIARAFVRKYPDGAAVAAALERGEIDVALPNSLSLDQAVALKGRRPDAVQIRSAGIVTFLLPDLGHPLLGRRDVRRALMLALDRDAIRAALHGAAGQVADVPNPAARPAGVTAYAHDPARARALLASAGAAGATIPLFHRKLGVEQRTADMIAAQLTAVGLRPELKPVEDLGALVRQRTHGGLVLGIAKFDDEQPALAAWNLPQAGGRADAAARHDAYDDTVARLADREAHALFPERRTQLRRALDVAFSERLPLLPLVYPSERLVADPALAGWDPGATGMFGQSLARWRFVAATAKPATAPAAAAPVAKP